MRTIKTFAYIQADCLSALKNDFITIVSARPLEVLKKSDTDSKPYGTGFKFDTVSSSNLFVDFTLLSRGGNKSAWARLMQKVQTGDVIYVASLRVFDTADDFVEAMYDFKEKGIYLYAAEEGFASSVFNYESTLKLLSILNSFSNIREVAEPPHNFVDYPADFEVKYSELKQNKCRAADICEAYNISMPTLRRLVENFER